MSSHVITRLGRYWTGDDWGDEPDALRVASINTAASIIAFRDLDGCCIETSDEPPHQPRYRVKYYDRKLSHRGKGVQVRRFHDRDQAEAFASRNQIYSGPCRVEEVGS